MKDLGNPIIYDIEFVGTRGNSMASVIIARKSRNMSVTVVAVIGILFVIAGAAIATIPGTGLRGSGLGTILLVIGIVLLLVAVWRFTQRSREPTSGTSS
jgi:uncharacterized membrane protein (DUF373 family)